MKKRKQESGQAILELLVLVGGFMLLFLGLIFVCGLTDADIVIFLRARNNAELQAASGTSLVAGGSEFSSVSHGELSLYESKETLAFSPTDYVGSSPNNTLKSFHPELNKKTEFEKTPLPEYALQAEIKQWKSLRDADDKVFISDFVPSLSTKNALHTAFLVSGKAPLSAAGGTLVTWCSCLACNPWVKINVSAETLVEAQSNKVYMPLFSRQDMTK